MDVLRQLFESAGYENVETFIASGNVIFDGMGADPAELEGQIENLLKDSLGYKVNTFIRSDVELSAIASYSPFSKAALDASAALNVAFVSEPPDESAILKLMACKTDIDDFQIHQREIYWLCRKKQSESTFSNSVLEKAIGKPSTLRGISTIQKLAAKYAPRR